MVVYIDVVIVENLVVNFFLLYITSKTVRIKVKLIYILCAATLGSLYVFTLFYPILNKFSHIPFKIFMAFLMVFICFRKKDILFNIKSLCIFMMYSMVLAGACLFIQYNNSELNFSEFAIINFSYKKLLISIMIIYMLIDRIIIYVKDRKDLNNLIYNLDIAAKGKKINVKAFLDTGNELREPATNLPVIIVEKSIFFNMDLSEYDKFYIPYKVVNGYNGKLVGFKPEYIKISDGKSEKITEAIIALGDNKLSSLGEFNALLSRGVI